MIVDIAHVVYPQVLVPTFEIARNPTISLSEIRAYRYRLVDEAEAIRRKNDKNIFETLIENGSPK